MSDAFVIQIWARNVLVRTTNEYARASFKYALYKNMARMSVAHKPLPLPSPKNSYFVDTRPFHAMDPADAMDIDEVVPTGAPVVPEASKILPRSGPPLAVGGGQGAEEGAYVRGRPRNARTSAPACVRKMHQAVEVASRVAIEMALKM
jgi:hypothetical protein